MCSCLSKTNTTQEDRTKKNPLARVRRAATCLSSCIFESSIQHMSSATIRTAISFVDLKSAKTCSSLPIPNGARVQTALIALRVFRLHCTLYSCVFDAILHSCHSAVIITYLHSSAYVCMGIHPQANGIPEYAWWIPCGRSTSGFRTHQMDLTLLLQMVRACSSIWGVLASVC